MRLIITLAVLLVLSGCVIGGPSGGYAFIDARIEPLVSGGLILIPADQPGASYESFITLENRMAEPARNIRIQTSNVNYGIVDFSALDSTNIDDLSGFEEPDGTLEEWFTEINASVPITTPRTDYSTRIDYHLCAEARTVYTGTICLSPNDNTRSFDEACVPQTVEIREGQQAPVAITRISQVDSLSRVSITIEAINYGPGLVFDSDTSCARISQQDTGKIILESLTISGEDVTASCAQREARMGFSEKYQAYTGTSFTCSIVKSDIGIADLDSTVETDITVELSYDYHILADSHTIIIRKG